MHCSMVVVNLAGGGAVHYCWHRQAGSLPDNSRTNQPLVSQIADWLTHGIVNSLTAKFFKSQKDSTLFVH